MMNSRRWKNRLAASFVLVATLATGAASAAVLKPQLDVAQLGGDGGVTTNLSGDVSMDGTVIGIINPDNSFTDTPDVDFLLSASGAAGSLAVDGGAVLAATFTNLALIDLTGGFFAFSADLTYTGGSAAGTLGTGRIEGSFMLDSVIGDITVYDNLTAKIGAVSAVPVPAALPLFFSGLLGVVVVARRRA